MRVLLEYWIKGKAMIDILITSASRPDYLKRTVDSILEHVHSKDQFRWLLHEDVVRKSDSLKNIKWVMNSGLFDEMKVTYPAKRHGNAIKELLNMAQSEYIFRSEDDCIILKNINLDEVLNVFNIDKKVNQIGFREMNTSTLKENEVIKGERCLTMQFPEWNLVPSIWRLSFIRPRWIVTNRGEVSHHLFSGLNKKKYSELIKNKSWLQENLGSYWWGDGFATGYVKHIGVDATLYAQIEKKNEKRGL